MIVRELVTLLKYDVDRSGIEEYSSALKHLAGWVAGLFAAHEVMELADQWNTVAGRVLNVTDSVAEQTKVMDALQKQAEATGQSFEGIGSLFTQLESSRETIGYTTDQVLGLTSAISELVTLGGGTAAGGKRGMIQLEEMFALDKVQMQHLRSLMIDIPGSAGIIAKSFGGMKPFMEMVHTGKITGKMLADAITAQVPEINRRFANMPMTFARAFETIHSLFGRLIYDVGQSSGVWATLATGIVNGGRWIVETIREMAYAVGGFTNLIETAGIVFIAAMGPGALAMLGRLIVAIRSITVASVLAAAPWYLMAALILAVGLAVQDVWTWLQGGRSITEDLIGPWRDWKTTVIGWRDTVVGAIDDIQARIAVWAPELTAVRDNFAALFTDAFGNLLSGFDQSKQTAAGFWEELKQGWLDSGKQLTDFATAMKELFPSLGQMGDYWTLGGQIRRSIADVAELLRSIQAVGGWLNSVSETVSGAGTSVHDYIVDTYNRHAPAAGSGQSGWLPSWVPWSGTPAPVSPAAMMPGGGASTGPITATVTNNITTANDNPAAIGEAAAKGTKSGIADGLGRSLGIMSPQTEYGVGY